MNTSARLRQLADEATPGPWAARHGMGSLALRKDDGSALRLAIFDDRSRSDMPDTNGVANARLAALAPELANWAADAADAFEEYGTHGVRPATPPSSRSAWEHAIVPNLLARLAGIVGAEE